MDNHAYILYPYEGSTFVLVPCGIDYRIWGLDSAAEEIRFPRKFQDGYISPQITLNNSSDPAVPFFHQFHNVRRIYLPEWMTSFEAENFLFPKLKEIVIPTNYPWNYRAIGPLLFRDDRLVKVFSVGYRKSFTFSAEVLSVDDFAFAHTTITDVHFANSCIHCEPHAFEKSQLRREEIVYENSKFILYGSLLFQCEYASSVVKIPEQVRSFEENAFKGTYHKTPDGNDSYSHGFIVEVDSPVPILSNYQLYGMQHLAQFSGIKKYRVHSFVREQFSLLQNASNLPSLESFEIIDDLGLKCEYVTHDGVLFSHNMKKLLLYPRNKPDDEYTVPEGVEEIGRKAFYFAQNLRRVHLPKSVKKLAVGCFYKSCVEEIPLPQSVKCIETLALSSAAIREITLSPNVKEIECNSLFGISKIRCHEGTVPGLFPAINDVDCELLYDLELEITRTNGELLRIQLPKGLLKSGFNILNKAWKQPTFDINAYFACYAHISGLDDKQRFAFQVCRDFGIDNRCAAYLKRAAMDFAQELIAQKAQDDLIALIKLGFLKPKALQKLLAPVNRQGMHIASAYILATLQKSEGRREELQL